MLVLLAAITDLLLPNTNIQKYARMVIGLLIILTLLSPIVSLLQMDNWGDLISANIRSLQNTNSKASDIAIIENKARIFGEAIERDILAQFTQTLKDEIKAHVAFHFQHDAEVEVSAQLSKNSVVKIDKVVVYLYGRVHKKDNRDNPYYVDEAIKTIPVVQIAIREENVDEKNENIDSTINDSTNAIYTYLISNYRLQKDQVFVVAK